MPIGMYSHNHTQDVAADTWTIVHNLGTNAPVVDVYVDIDGSRSKIIPKEVKVVDNKTLQIVFSETRTGVAAIR